MIRLHTFQDLMLKNSSMSIRSIQARTAVVALLLFFGCWNAGAQEAVEVTIEETTVQPEARGIDTSQMEEVVVSGVRDEILNAITIQDFHDMHFRGEHYYRTRQYKKAFPYLLAAAKRGFKLSQARVGFIYQQGLGDVPRNGEAAVGWLGAAASAPTDPEILTYFRRVMNKIPDTMMPYVNQIVADYREKYGPAATGNDCQLIRSAGSHISRLRCNFQEEFQSRDALFDDALSGLTNPLVDPNSSVNTSVQSAPSSGGN